MFGHALKAHADHLSEAHPGGHVAFSNGIEARNQRPLRRSAALFESDCIDGRWRGRIPVRILDGSPHEPLRRHDLLKDAIDRELHSVGSLHHMVPGPAGAPIHLADRIRKPRPAIPQGDMLWISDGGPDKFTWRIEYAGDDDYRLVHRTDVNCRCHWEISSVDHGSKSSIRCWPKLVSWFFGFSLLHDLEMFSQAVEASVPEALIALEPFEDLEEGAGLEMTGAPLRF